MVGTAELDAPSGPALRDALDVADGSAVGVAFSVLVTGGFVVGVGSDVGMGEASAGARCIRSASSTHNYDPAPGEAKSWKCHLVNPRLE